MKVHTASAAPGPACRFPHHSYHTMVSKIECILKCLKSKGCESINFRPCNGNSNTRKGDCIIIAPSVDGQSVSIPDLADSTWMYSAVSY